MKAQETQEILDNLKDAYNSYIKNKEIVLGIAKEAYKKELLQLLLGELGNTEEIEKYYIKLPKNEREEWVSNNTFYKLAKYLKASYPENKIYYDSSDQEELNNGWVNLAGELQ
ncbi:MAG TPA: hypothetical protein LFW21_03845 [Rickettsia endosymbiont of Pyrocoelia pectoralis]|nr:hypothetical protein [Rickettsia endosymbiont of Pyrocoelia pectoralis]